MNRKKNNVESDNECLEDEIDSFFKEINNDSYIFDKSDYEKMLIHIFHRIKIEAEKSSIDSEKLNSLIDKYHYLKISLNEFMEADESNKIIESKYSFVSNIPSKDLNILEKFLTFIITIMYRNSIGQTIKEFSKHFINLRNRFVYFSGNLSLVFAFFSILFIHVLYFSNIISLQIFSKMFFLYIYIIYFLLFIVRISGLITVEEKEMCLLDSLIYTFYVLILILFDLFIHEYLYFHQNKELINKF